MNHSYVRLLRTLRLYLARRISMAIAREILKQKAHAKQYALKVFENHETLALQSLNNCMHYSL